MKVRTSVKPICPDCRVFIRGNKSGKKIVRVSCRKSAKHKQRQG